MGDKVKKAKKPKIPKQPTPQPTLMTIQEMRIRIIKLENMVAAINTILDKQEKGD